MLARSVSSYIELNDLASEIDKLAGAINADPQRLSLVNNRLDTIYSLIQKHRVKDLGELIIRREEIRKLVKSIETGDERLAELESLLKTETGFLMKLAENISGKRKSILTEAEKNIAGTSETAWNAECQVQDIIFGA